jgi:pyruvate,water dikinase
VASSEYVSWFVDIGLEHRPAVGGKGASLGELTRAGVAVPAGFVVRTEAFRRFVGALPPIPPLTEAEDLAGMTAFSEKVRARIEGASLPDDLAAALAEAHVQLVGADADAPVAVRSSATSEDAADASFAGLQDTFLWVKGRQATLEAVRRCWSSLYSPPALAYRRKKGLAEDGAAMAVVVQRMVDARTAGVMFTRSPTTGDRSVVTIEAAWGLGSSVVGGEVTPDRFVIGKITGEISVRDISDKQAEHRPAPAGGVAEVPVPEDRRTAPSISDEELGSLLELARRIERRYGCAQDIEWAIDRADGQIAILQSRPETVWSSREAAPVAEAHENPIAHVMRIFGGVRS